MKIKIKKSLLKESIEKQISYVLEKKSTPLMSATFKLLEMFEECNDLQKKTLKEVFGCLEEELYLAPGELSSLVNEACEAKIYDKEDKKDCTVCGKADCVCKKDLKDNKLQESNKPQKTSK